MTQENNGLTTHSFEEYFKKAKRFHGFAAPGVLIGGFMVNKAKKGLPVGTLSKSLCETSHCLPDALQLLTPCTIGNGRLRIISLGHFALSIFHKDAGIGSRVSLDLTKLEPWSEIRDWHMKLKTKKERDYKTLLRHIREAGESILLERPIKIKPGFIGQTKLRTMAICPACGESFPAAVEGLCLACRGEGPYERLGD